MGNVYRGIHEKIALKARDHYKITALVETGTYRAETTLWAKDRFEKVISIEISDEFYRISEEKIGIAHNVLLIKGDSRDWLPSVCRGRDNKPTMFWLDAHFVGEDGTKDPKGLALMDEINIINQNFYGPHVILVDDYLALNYKGWIKTDEVVKALEDKGNHDRDVVIVDDIFFACPKLPQDFEMWKK